jgi:hypothetical protein
MVFLYMAPDKKLALQGGSAGRYFTGRPRRGPTGM